MSIETMLHQEIKAELDELSRLQVGSEEHEKAVNSIVKLADRAIEMERLGIESQEKVENREAEIDLKLKQIAEERKGRISRDLFGFITFAGTAAITIWGTKASFQFEKDGTITTIMGRGFINKLLPKK